mmetsp:Transcript_25887/g.36303  ORF Transcript_25887/g.36303 Transcript_25887/m.36303 type:complete len:254 (-) Transcript_25887:919-1680(-)
MILLYSLSVRTLTFLCTHLKQTIVSCVRKKILVRLVVQANRNVASLEISAITLLNGLFSVFLVEVPHDTKALFPPVRSFHDISALDVTMLTEKVFEVLPVCVEGQVSNIELSAWCASSMSMSATTFASTTAAAASTASTTSSATLLAVFTNVHRPSVQFGVLKLTDCSGSFLWTLVDNNSTSHRTTFRVGENRCLIDITSLTHVVLEILPTRFIGKVPDINRSSLTAASSLVETSCSPTACFSVFPDKNHASL